MARTTLEVTNSQEMRVVAAKRQAFGLAKKAGFAFWKEGWVVFLGGARSSKTVCDSGKNYREGDDATAPRSPCSKGNAWAGPKPLLQIIPGGGGELGAQCREEEGVPVSVLPALEKWTRTQKPKMH